MSTVKGVAKLKKILYPKGVRETGGGWTIASFKPVDIEEGNIETHRDFGTFSVKGDMPPLKEGSEYYFVIEEGERHPTFGLSYDTAFMRQNVNLDENDEKSVRDFMEIILTKRQVDALYEAFENPIQVIEAKDIQQLTTAKGVGLKTAQRIIDHYESQKDYSHAYIELGKFDITPKTIRKITDFYGSPELAVSKIKENPYELMRIDGFAFKSCDDIFLKLGKSVNDPIRIKAFLVYIMQEEAGKGNTWSTPMSIIEATAEFIPQADKSLIGKTLLDNPDDFYLNEDKSRISLLNYQKLETLVASQLTRLIEADNNFEYDGWEDEVKETEAVQGWSFTKQQKQAMGKMMESNVFLLEGLAGSGKSTSLKAVVDVLEAKGYVYAQTALSGKASNNLALITGKDGYTIHRLLGFSPINGGFYYNQKTKLPYDIIIIDEISMVDARLFGHLLLAIRTGAKLIMLGDSEQLPSIGVPVMMPMIKSGVIPRMMLTEIHRQAQKSAIVTHSIAIREGKNPMSKELGRQVYGELEDLEYENVEDEDKIFFHVVKEFHKHIQNNDIKDVQILSATKSKGKASCLVLNKACQKIYNPESPDKEEVQVGKEDTGYVLRVGDKVINVKNNYNSVDENGMECPVFNGNIGILEYFDVDEDGDKFMAINFEGIGMVRIYEGSYNTIELAYSITVHKSQGMGVPIVIVAFPFHFMLNSRQFLYTAVTRAKKFCAIITSMKTMRSAISKNVVADNRTYLPEYLNTFQKVA